MLTREQNQLLTEIGPDKPMGDYLRRYWHPIAGLSEFQVPHIRALRLFGEDLVLYKDKSGTFGLVGRYCSHRGADLAHGMTEPVGIRCNYHGWRFDQAGRCVEQPFEDTVRAGKGGRGPVHLTAYRVSSQAGMLWAYLGPEPVPQLPDWEPFSWANGFSQVVISHVPCNWLQCQENSIDPVHFEWMHENWGRRLSGHDGPYGPTHLKLEFEEFDYGLIYKRIKQDTDETHGNWTEGRVCLWPIAFFLGQHFEWRVPIDDENTLSITWKYTRVPHEQEPYVQERIPTWWGPTHATDGRWITSHVMNQDFVAWCGQGRIAKRENEHLVTSDKGIHIMRNRLFEELSKLAAGRTDLKGLITDPDVNHHVHLPMMDRDVTLKGLSKAQIMASPLMRVMSTSYPLQAGQPEDVRRQFSQAMGLEITEFQGIAVALARHD